MRALLVAASILAGAAVAAGPAAAEPQKLWELDGLRQPESALFDASGGVIYVSEVVGDMRAKDGVGAISKVSPDGKMVEADWVTGLDAPKGLALSGGKLYVADIDQLVEIEIASARIVARHPVPGAIFLNDVASDPAGRVFVSDTMTNTIWTLQGGEMKPWLKHDALKGPNGLTVEGDGMIVAGFGKPPSDGQAAVPGNLVEAPLSGETARDLGDGSPVGALDGLVALGGGKYLATDYLKGPLYLIDAKGSFEVLAELPPGSADLSFDPASRTAFVPLNKAGKLLAFRIP
ncbi:SMP-30/gluconolactonase/LRE family protein [Hansschlegelia zhihuaiae]|uniref:ATP/GTP-binding protein n=1 Tax=Hansschlegelia zhihuaiae TaxID=405005 RepID=A0A4Q0MKX7_9HYPH|nr:hypothetical protein [Hansschlegelia zhihuaiae]RXF74288.1 hypothetical protein EK403_05520 [Hansschlegelia zhihuaiae]